MVFSPASCNAPRTRLRSTGRLEPRLRVQRKPCEIVPAIGDLVELAVGAVDDAGRTGAAALRLVEATGALVGNEHPEAHRRVAARRECTHQRAEQRSPEAAALDAVEEIDRR